MKLHLKPSRENNSESMKARVVILVRGILAWPGLHSCEVSWLYSKGYSSYRVDTKLHLKWSRENNSESMTERVVILVRDASSWPVLHNCEVSSKYSKRYSSDGAYTKLHLKPSRGNNSECMTAVLHNCEVSWLYQVTERTQIRIKKHQRVDNSKSIKSETLIFVRDTLSWPVLHNSEVSSKYSKRYSSYWADTKMFTDGQITDGRQAHRYIPRTFWSGDKK